MACDKAGDKAGEGRRGRGLRIYRPDGERAGTAKPATGKRATSKPASPFEFVAPEFIVEAAGTFTPPPDDR